MTRTPISEAGTDIKYDADLLAAQAQEHIDKFRKRMKDIAEECLGEIYCNITPYIETDTWTNYREALRLELQHEYMFSNFKQPWATDFRRAVFVENREEISKLIEADMLKRIKSLEDCKQEYDQFRYSPGGDRYQDKVKELDCLKAKHERLLEALREKTKRSNYEWSEGYAYSPDEWVNEGQIACALEILSEVEKTEGLKK